MRQNLEIPQGKRTRLYRFLEILPGLISYSAIILLFILSLISPILGSIYLFIIIAATLVKAIGVAYRTIQGYEVIKRAERVDWRKRMEDLENPHSAYERLRDDDNKSYHFKEHVENLKMMSTVDNDYPDPAKTLHVVIMAAYNEGYEIIAPSIKSVADNTFPNDRIIFVLAYEARGGEEIEKTAQRLASEYKGKFKDFLLVKHPADLPGEVVGKGPNLTYAGEAVAKYFKEHNLPVENAIVTSLDSDNHMAPKYLDCVAYEFITHSNRQHLSFQPVSLFMNNIWDAPAPSRVIAVSNSFYASTRSA